MTVTATAFLAFLTGSALAWSLIGDVLGQWSRGRPARGETILSAFLAFFALSLVAGMLVGRAIGRWAR
jgi:uncharacterized membrane protein required for colicin V production